MVPDELCINSAVLKSMSDEDRAAFQKAATDSISACFDLCAEMRDSYQKTCEDKGVVFTEVDITPFQENMAPFIQEVAGRSDMSKSVYDIILSER
jgi:TRAP-type C4-dicarboxylate transport system substrate-binding protein